MSFKLTTGIITGYEIGLNKSGTKNVVLLQVRITDQDDIQTVELMNNAGDGSIPAIGSRVIISQLGPAWKIGVAISDNIDPEVQDGEVHHYSQDAGIIKAFIKLLKSGIIEINGNTDFAVRFSVLETGFNQLKADFNAFLLHVHSGVTIGPGTSGPPAPPAVPSTASIAGAKIDEVKVP